ncbi:hypothetical protein BVY03_03600 [bacterium K02(2017)]|nr:hypothetical protein BVY03_03600 [bacterium K02(2017)]
MSLFTWILIVSLHNRNPIILDCGDRFLRYLLFWMIFLPLGARYSIDQIKAKYNIQLSSFYSPGTAAIIIQIIIMYFFAALLKQDEMWFNGQAAQAALLIDQQVKPFGQWLLNFPTILPYLGYFVLKIGGFYWGGLIFFFFCFYI